MNELLGAHLVDAMNVGIAVLIVALGGWAVIARDAFAAVAGFITLGLVLTLAWVQLHGIDVALTEAAIGGGLTGALLIVASGRLRQTEAAAAAERPGRWTRLIAAVVAVAITLALMACVLALPDPAPTLAGDVVAHIGATGVGNPITAVLLAFRAMDTLLEAIVLVFALIGVWSLAADDAWGGHPGLRQDANPNGILAYAARVLPPIGIVVGMYMLWVGADAPGGKFQGATILAAMWLLVIMAGIIDTPPIGARWVRLIAAAGPLVFVAIGIAGVPTAGAFLAYPDGYAKTLILIIELTLMPTLAVVLALLVTGAPKRIAKR